MNKKISLFILSFAISFQVQADIRNFWRFLYRPVPLEKSHTYRGYTLQNELNPFDIDVLVWNIKKTSMNKWEEEFLDFGKDKELILVQEYYDGEIFKKTIEGFTQMRWDMAASFSFPEKNNITTGTMIGSVATPSEVVVTQSSGLEPVTRTPKTIIFAKYPIAGRNDHLLVISVHGINLKGQKSFEHHMIQAKNEIEKHDGPILFAGDFNTRTKKRTRYLFSMVDKLGLEEVTFKNGQYRMEGAFSNNFLDHAFIRGLHVENAEVIPDSSGSDHKPLILKLSLNN